MEEQPLMRWSCIGNMQIKVIRSGSKENCTFIQTETTSILIDIGCNFLTLKTVLERENIDINKIDSVLITHIHSDHTRGLKTLLHQLPMKVVIPEKMTRELSRLIDPKYFEIVEEKFTIGDLAIEWIPTSHDTEASVGYIISSKDKELVYITDTGYINRKYFQKLSNKDLYVIESNHDEAMLMDGPYPPYLKQRILSDEGHLSNATTARYLSKFIGPKTKTIILAHVSEKNNTYELVYETIKNKLESENIKIENILVAHQQEELPLIEV